MDKKTIKKVGMLFAIAALILTAVIIRGSIRVFADNGETVRVSTAKQLKAAIKRTDVGTIIFRTEAYINVTIKADENAKTKSLIIDAPNVNFTNKAVFSDIKIRSAKKYIESVSGNRISIYDNDILDGFFVSKKKKVKKLTILNSYGEFRNNYTLRKGAKIEELELIYTGEFYPVKSSYDKSKRQLTIEGFYYDDDCIYIIKLDKNGRMVSIDCESDSQESYYSELFSYDSNGNLIRIIGTDNMYGKFTKEITYSGNLEQKSIYKGEYESTVYISSYDENGRLAHREFTGEDSSDGEILVYSSINVFEYDKNGRLIYDRWDSVEGDTFYETSYTYNSKGFLTMLYDNSSGSVTVYEYKYNKAGSMIEFTQKFDGQNETQTYEYDEFGDLIDVN